MYATKADSVFKKKPDSKGDDAGSGSGSGNVPKTDVNNGTRKTDAPPPPADPKKNAAMFNMFGDNAEKMKEPEPVKQQVPPQPPVNK